MQMTVEIDVYEKRSYAGFAREAIFQIYNERRLLLAMIRRDIRARYKNTALGWLWSLIRPLISLAVYIFVIGKILGASKGTQDFGLYVFTGFLSYTTFVNISVGVMKSAVDNADLIKKINFPRIFLPLASCSVALIDTLINFGVLLLGYVIYGSWPAPEQLLLLPVAFSIVVLYGLSIGLVGAVINVRIRDFGYLFEILINLGIWLTPMLYTYNFVLEAFKNNLFYLRLYLLNPMANVVIEFQKALWPPAADDSISAGIFPGQLGVRLILLALSGIIMFFFAVGFYMAKSRKFSEFL